MFKILKIPSVVLHKLRDRCHKLDKKVVDRAHHGAHMSYLSAVAYEAHGLYAYCAGGLLVVVIISLLAGEGEAE